MVSHFSYDKCFKRADELSINALFRRFLIWEQCVVKGDPRPLVPRVGHAVKVGHSMHVENCAFQPFVEPWHIADLGQS